MSTRFRPPHRTPRTPPPGGFAAVLTLTLVILALAGGVIYLVGAEEPLAIAAALGALAAVLLAIPPIIKAIRGE
ncbi:hypothetical protein [Actinomadura sp. K4S16]|uniref:hypothetical protein n=1 Tax=Actinomadura sp. K4S16 TaxID=1316147 RepID=UPI0011ED9E61|nr:hypothetical protein [Actinomadura sp. K4S16]